MPFESLRKKGKIKKSPHLLMNLNLIMNTCEKEIS
jgi:hypothetical protein